MTGRTVSLAAPIASEVTPGNPDPAVHQMTHWADDSAAEAVTATGAARSRSCDPPPSQPPRTAAGQPPVAGDAA